MMLHATSADSLNDMHYGDMDREHMMDTVSSDAYDGNWQENTETVSGTIRYENKTAVFTPDRELEKGTLYTFIVTSGVKNTGNMALK